ncbi:hypothetical protein EON62_00980 [archaeon]|nr:MAG: hypothetical protein EON62_00980 [archaeon]
MVSCSLGIGLFCREPVVKRIHLLLQPLEFRQAKLQVGFILSIEVVDLSSRLSLGPLKFLSEGNSEPRRYDLFDGCSHLFTLLLAPRAQATGEVFSAAAAQGST